MTSRMEERTTTDTRPLISIVIPSLNQGRFLAEMLQSIADQDYPRTECIVIDGGSTDETREVLRAHGDLITYWVSEPDRGQSHAINKGFARCTGDIIAFSQADDRYEPGAFIDVAARYAGHPDAGVFAGAFRFIDGQSLSVGGVNAAYLRASSPLDMTLGPPGLYRIHQVATFYSRTALQNAGMHVREDLSYVMDRELLYRVAKRAPVVISPKVYGAFRRHAGSKSGTRDLSFALEFASLYRGKKGGTMVDHWKRNRMARYRTAVGRLDAAKGESTRARSWGQAIRAVILYPSLLWTWSFLSVLRRGGGRTED